MVKDILRFNKESVADLDAGKLATRETQGTYLDRKRYSPAFCKDNLLAMTSAIWSADISDARDFPVEFFIRFFRNHGLLQVANRPQWRVIEGGSREYIPPLTFGFEDRIFLNHPVLRVERIPGRGENVRSGYGERHPTGLRYYSRWCGCTPHY
jgi:predicted NAD/FAD-binding protein